MVDLMKWQCSSSSMTNDIAKCVVKICSFWHLQYIMLFSLKLNCQHDQNAWPPPSAGSSCSPVAGSLLGEAIVLSQSRGHPTQWPVNHITRTASGSQVMAASRTRWELWLWMGTTVHCHSCNQMARCAPESDKKVIYRTCARPCCNYVWTYCRKIKLGID